MTQAKTSLLLALFTLQSLLHQMSKIRAGATMIDGGILMRSSHNRILYHIAGENNRFTVLEGRPKRLR